LLILALGRLDVLPESDRTWQCPLCGTMHDRDLNAALNLLNAALNIRDEGLRILAVGYQESRNACGGVVRPPKVARPSEARSRRL
jgi:putative transposase